MASDIFIKIDGITGEAQDAEHIGEIDVAHWTWNIQQSSFAMSGSGGGAPKATVYDLVFMHAIDRASPSLMTACLNGKHIAKVVLTMRKSGGFPIDYYKMTMSDVVITGVHPTASGDNHYEQIHLSFSAVKQEYQLQHASGGTAGMVTGSFDIKNNKQA